MKIENRFFNLSNQEQKRFQLKLGIAALFAIIILGIILFCISSKLLFLVLIALVLIIQIIAPFYDVPSLVKQDKLKYYSLFLLAEKEDKGVITIHGGTLFDYYFTFKKEMTMNERTKLVLVEYLKGLIELTKEAKEDVVLEGTSYIINERTAEKIGFKKVSTSSLQKLILTFNCINLLASFFILKRKIVFPNLNNIITFQAKVLDIKKRETFLKSLIAKVTKNDVD